MSHHFTPGRLQVSLTPYQERPRGTVPQNSYVTNVQRSPYAPTVTRSPYTPGNSNTVPRTRNPTAHAPVRTLFGVRIRNPLSPSHSSPPGPQSPFGPSLRFRYPPTTPTTPTAQTPFGPALRPRTPSQGFALSPTTPSSPSPFGPTLRTRSPSPLPQSPSPTQTRLGYIPGGTLNRSSSALSLHQYPHSPGTLNRNSYEVDGSNRNPSMNRGSYQANGYNRNGTAATLNRIPSYEGNNYNYARNGAATLNRTSYEAGNYSRNSGGGLSQYPAKSMHQINRNPSTASKFSRKASYDAPLPIFPPPPGNRSATKENSSTPPPPPNPVRRSPSASSTKRKAPHTNKGSQLLSDDENQEIYTILGKGRQTLSSAVVQLLFPSPDNEHRWKLREVGILCFVRDSTKKSYFLEVISLRMRRVIFSQEIYEEFDYRMPRPKYLTFEGDGFRVGISFADKEESSDFKAILDQKMDAKRQRRIDRQTKQYVQGQAVTPAPNQQIVTKSPQTPPPLNRMQHQWNGNSQNQTFTIDHDAKAPEPFEHNIALTQPAVKTKKSRLPFGRSKGNKVLKAAKNGKPAKLDKSAIGAPTDFKHVQHAGFDPKRGFVSDGIDDSKYLKILEQAGYGMKAKALLQDKDTRQYIYNFVEDYEQSVSNPSSPIERPNPSSVPPPPSKMPGIMKAPSAPNPPPPVPNRAPPATKETSAIKVIPPPPPFTGNMAAPNSAPPQQQRQEHRAQHIPPPLSANNAPPPPPPFPSSNVPPPPPPPMPSEFLSSNRQANQDAELDRSNPGPRKNLPTMDDGRSNLMKQIQEAQLNTLKKVDPNSSRKAPGGMSDVFSEIRSGAQLKKTEESDRTQNKSPETMDGLAGALARALAERSKAINPESSGSEDNEDFESDSEWDD